MALLQSAQVITRPPLDENTMGEAERQCFDLFQEIDLDNSQYLDEDEVQALGVKLGHQLSNEAVGEAMVEMGADMECAKPYSLPSGPFVQP